MRNKIVAGNWKMNKNLPEAEALLTDIRHYLHDKKPGCQVWIAPPAPYLFPAKSVFADGEVGILAQDISIHTSGAYTGEISAAMVSSLGATGTLVGHSERRQYFGETDEACEKKIRQALDQGLTPVYCIGETLEERKANRHFEVVKTQTETALKGLTAEEAQRLVLAYEPVWAIGTGETASPEQAQEIHAHIRKTLATMFDRETASSISILYGGSVKPENAKEIFSQPDIDGGLIGGAALKIEDFSKIIEAYN